MVEVTDQWDYLRSKLWHNFADTLPGFEKAGYPTGSHRGNSRLMMKIKFSPVILPTSVTEGRLFKGVRLCGWEKGWFGFRFHISADAVSWQTGGR